MAPSRTRRTTPDPAPPDPAPPDPAPPDPAPPEPMLDLDGGSSGVHHLLTQAVEEAARLLEADGAMVYLVDPVTGRLRFAHDSGIRSQRTRDWIRGMELEPGTGMFGRAVADRTVVVTGDYLSDTGFNHAAGPDRAAADIGIRSLVVAPLAAGDEVYGALGTFSVRTFAFDGAQIALVKALADHAAAAMANTRLIEELDRSRTLLDRSLNTLARRADAEQALREIAARITALRDPAEILQAVVELASRLVRGDGAILDLLDPASGLLRWAYDDGIGRQFSDEERAKLWIAVGEGATGRAVAEDRVIVAGDDLENLFPPGPDNTMFYARTGYRSMITAPITGEAGPLGVIEVYAVRPVAFDDADGALIRALASQAAIAIVNARLITDLAESRAALARTADAERTLREIAARVSAILDPAEVLDRIVVEAARLLESDGARIDLWDDGLGALRWAYSAGDAMIDVPKVGPTGGLAGLAFAVQAPVVTADYLADDRFETTPESETFVRNAGIRAVIATPLSGEGGDPLGVLSVVSRQPGVYTQAEVDVLTALATHASIAITNANLMEALGRSQADIARRAEAERSLRQIAARITALREPDDVLQHVVDEARRLLRADGALIDQYDPDSGTLQWAYDAGLPDEQRRAFKMTNLRLGEGVAGKAVAERLVIHVGDYLSGSFQHDELSDSLVKRAGIRDLIAAPIIGDAGPLGALEVLSHRPNAFDDFDAAVLGGLAEQAAIAITNARLIDALERSKAALARRVETERSLRDITARIAALRDPDEVLVRVVEDAKRLLATDGAHLTRMSPEGDSLVPVVVAGGADEPTRDWLLAKRFPIGGGINGLAARDGIPTWTSEYLTDPRIPHEPDDQDVARRMGLVGMAAAPLRAPGGEVIGTLAISTAAPRAFDPDDLDLLQGLADQAAIALTNSNLLARVTREEARFRGLVQTTPDVIWRADPEGIFTFMADSATSLFGWTPGEVIGRHFGFLTDPDSMPLAIEKYLAVGRDPDLVERVPLILVRRDRSTFAAEVTTTGVFEDGRWVGAQGTVRDVSDRSRLERELRESEERYRTLASSSPDLVFATDAQGRYTFLSDRASTVLGWDREAALGRSFMEFVAPGWEAAAAASYQALVADPSSVTTARIDFVDGGGNPIPLEINIVGTLDGGRLNTIHGVARDVSERERLERELSQSEERYRFLIENSPDIIFSTDAEGRFTFMSSGIERITGMPANEVIGKEFSVLIDESTRAVAAGSWDALVAHPDQEIQAALVLRGRDGQLTPVDVRAIGFTLEGRFAGIQGATRDVSAQTRLQAELRRQAGELAAGEERAHLARELHDSVTQALFSMTLVSRSVELLLDHDPVAAREQLTQLRELQREALAEMRALIFELRPGNLEQDGLVHALKTHAAALQGRLGLPIVVETGLDGRLPLAAEEVLYRIAQEALHNVVKHAAARQVRVDVRSHVGGVRLLVEDDGRGFDPQTVPDGHLGLAGMRARADRVGAQFSCTSRRGEGTKIQVSMSHDVLVGMDG